MTPLYGLDPDSQWSRVVKRPPASAILDYLVAKWASYVVEFSGMGVAWYARSEPELTEALAAYLTREQESGSQPFDGEFFGELTRFDLTAEGHRIRVGRTDIEWRLYGFPNFIVEFKVLDAKRKASKYITDGMARFVDGRYGPRAPEGAMCAFIGPGSPESRPQVQALVEAHASKLRCVRVAGAAVITPSKIAPSVASFDSTHERDPKYGPISLAHLFVDLPSGEASLK